jgi:transcriptional regulator with XRE-family HTH domain
MVITSSREFGGILVTDIAEDVAYGRMVVQEGGLKVLRELLGLSRNAMAEMLYVTPETYANWEIFQEVQVWPQNASRIGRFYRSAMHQVEWLLEEGIDPRDIIPLHQYAIRASMSQEALLRAYRDGELFCLDLGILGLWLYRDGGRELS